METKLIRKLTEGQNFHVKVNSIQNSASEFASKNNPGQKMKCHWISIDYKEFPEPVMVQVCNEFDGITQFVVGDTIEVTARAYNMGKAMQSVAFVRLVSKKEMLQNLLNTPAADRQNNVPDHFEAKEGKVNNNPMIHGTLIGACMYNAALVHQGQKKIDNDAIIDTAEALYDWCKINLLGVGL